MVGFQIGWIVMTMCVCALSCVQLFVTPWTVACQALAWNFPGKNTGAGCHFLLQGIFPTQGSNLHLLCLLYWQVDFFTTAPLGKQVMTTDSIYRYTFLSLWQHSWGTSVIPEWWLRKWIGQVGQKQKVREKPERAWWRQQTKRDSINQTVSKPSNFGTFQVVQWLKLCTFTWGYRFDPWWGN